MSWWNPRRKEVERAHEAVCEAQRLRDAAEEQQRRAEAIVPRVEAAADSLKRLRTDNHFGPLMDEILRGAK